MFEIFRTRKERRSSPEFCKGATAPPPHITPKKMGHEGQGYSEGKGQGYCEGQGYFEAQGYGKGYLMPSLKNWVQE